MKKIKFDINKREQIESGKLKVVDEFGNEVSIIKWDSPSKDYPIVVMYSTGIADNFSVDGKCMVKEVPDIYIVSDEPDYTPFEQVVYDVLSRVCFVREETVHAEAKKLFEAAKKEISAPYKEDDVIEALKTLNLRILEISEEKNYKERRFWEQAWRLTNNAINSIVLKETLNC